jgi:hypothetical protein
LLQIERAAREEQHPTGATRHDSHIRIGNRIVGREHGIKWFAN